MDKHPAPYEYDHVAEGYACPECGRPQVIDDMDAYLWCINKDCKAFALMFESNYKEL